MSKLIDTSSTEIGLVGKSAKLACKRSVITDYEMDLAMVENVSMVHLHWNGNSKRCKDINRNNDVSHERRENSEFYEAKDFT